MRMLIAIIALMISAINPTNHHVGAEAAEVLDTYAILTETQGVARPVAGPLAGRKIKLAKVSEGLKPGDRGVLVQARRSYELLKPVQTRPATEAGGGIVVTVVNNIVVVEKDDGQLVKAYWRKKTAQKAPGVLTKGYYSELWFTPQ